jgi:hypothetical protein
MGMHDRDWYKDHHRQQRERESRPRWQLPSITFDRAAWFAAGAIAWAVFERYVQPWLMRR